MKYQTAAISGAGAETLAVVAAPGAGKRIEVLGYAFTMASGTATWKSATTALSGAMTGTVLVHPSGSGPALVCAANEALNLTTSAAAALGHVTYRVVKVGP